MSELDWIFTERTQRCLLETVVALEQSQPILSIAKRLRRQLEPQQSASLIELAQLRIKGRTKFSRSDAMYFTRKGLEQSTAERLAIYKASRFPGQMLIADICVGIGGDAIGLGGRGPIVGIDKDPVHRQFAAANLAAYGMESAEVVSIDFRDWQLPNDCCLHVDPDRRDQKRTIVPSMFQPSLTEIVSRMEQRLTAIKLAPASRVPSDLAARCHLEWIGDQRECKQQLAWFNHEQLAVNSKSATVLFNDGEQVTLHSEPQSLDYLPLAEEVAQFVIEPHATVIAAGLTDELAWRCAGRRLAADVAYITGNVAPTTRLVQTFQVLAVLPLQLKPIEQALNQLGLGKIEWKKRGVEAQTWEDLQRLKLTGDRPGVVLITRLNQKPLAIVARRLIAEPGDQESA